MASCTLVLFLSGLAKALTVSTVMVESLNGIHHWNQKEHQLLIRKIREILTGRFVLDVCNVPPMGRKKKTVRGVNKNTFYCTEKAIIIK